MVQSVRVHSLSDSLRCVGGMQMLLPLALCLRNSEVQDPRHFAMVVEMIAVLARSNEPNLVDLLKCRALSMLGHVLRGLPAQCATSETAKVLTQRLGSCVKDVPVLVAQHLVEVLTNFALWVKAPAAVQCEYWNGLFSKYYCVNVALMRSLFGAQALLDAMQFFAWHADARVVIWKCLQVVLAGAVGEVECVALANFMLTCQDAALVNEALRFVLNSLSEDSRRAFLARNAQGGGLVDFFVALLSRPSAEVRATALVLFSRLPALDTPSTAMGGGGGGSSNSSSSGSGGGGSSELLAQSSNVLFRALSVWPLDLSTASALMAILVDVRTLPLHAFTNAAQDEGMPKQLLADGPPFVHVEVLGLLLGLLPRAPLKLRAVLLHELSSVVLARPENMDHMLRLGDWQLRLLRVLMETEHDKSTKLDAASAIGAHTSTLFQALFLRAFRASPRAWELVQQTLALIAVHSQELAFPRYACSVLAGLLEQLVAEARSVVTQQAPAALLADYERKRGNCVMPNIARVALLVEDYLYYSLPQDIDQCVAECLAARASGLTTAPHPQRFSRVSTLLNASVRQRSPSVGLRMTLRAAARPGSPDPASAAAAAAAAATGSSTGASLSPSDSQWKDEPLAQATMELLTIFSLHTEAAWPYAVDPTSLRAGGGRRLSLRLATDLIRYSGARTTLEKTVLFLWSAFGKWSSGFKSEGLLVEPLYVVGMILVTLRQRHSKRWDESGPDVGSILMPLLRQLLRMVWPVVCMQRERAALPIPDAAEQDEAKADLGERALDAGAFLEALEKPHWRGLLETVQGVVSSHLGADTSFWIGIREQYLASFHRALDAVDRSVAQGATAEHEFSERSLECERRRVASERRRLDAVRAEHAAKRAKAERRAADLLRELARPGSPWAVDDAGADDRWKRDKFETHARLRPKVSVWVWVRGWVWVCFLSWARGLLTHFVAVQAEQAL